MEEQKISTEQEIINAAKKVFLEKGYKGATMRDIAAEASVALSMVNYYFRSKDKLFDIIFNEVFNLVSGQILKTVDDSKPLFNVIEDFVSVYIDVLRENPHVPGFVFAELSQNPERFIDKVSSKKELLKVVNSLTLKISEETEAGIIKEVNFFELFLNIISMVIFPFIAKPIVGKLAELSMLNYDELMNARKKNISQFVINAIKEDSNN